MPLAVFTVSALLPRLTVLDPLLPVSAWMVAPLVVSEISKLPLPDSVTPLEAAIEPEPVSPRMPPLTVVAPV